MPLEAFATCTNRILNRALVNGTRVVILPITTVPATVEVRAPYTNRETVLYNAALRSLARSGVQFVEEPEIFGSRRPDELCVDPETVHLNLVAHDCIAVWLAHGCDDVSPARPSLLHP